MTLSSFTREHLPSRNFVFLAVIILCAPISKSLSECRDYSNTFQQVGQNATIQGKSVVVSGHYGFAAEDPNPSGLFIFDLSDPTMPSMVSLVGTPGGPRQVVIQGNLAYLADGFNGLQIVDVSSPQAPFLRGHWTMSTSLVSITVAGELVFGAAVGGGLAVFDVSDPDAPVLLAQVPTTGSAWEIAVQGTTVYVVTTGGPEARLQLFDVSAPTAPVPLGNIFLDENATASLWKGIEIEGSLVYVSVRSAPFMIVDVADPMNPTLLGSISVFGTGDAGGDVTLRGSIAYVTGPAGLQLFDVSIPSSPIHTGTYPGNYTSAALYGDHLVTTDISEGCKVFHPGDHDLANELGRKSGYTLSVCINGPLAYIGGDNLLVLDISDPTAPTTVGQVQLFNSTRAIDVDGTSLFLVNGSLHVYDIADPTTPMPLDIVSTPGTARDVIIRDGIGYLCEYSNGFLMIDATPPYDDPILSSIDTPGESWALDLSGDLLYVADGTHGLSIYNVANPDSPVFVGAADTPGTAVEITVEGDIACIADGAEGVQIFDVANPANPLLVGTIGGEEVSAVSLHNHILYFGGESARVADLSQPASPIVLGGQLLGSSSFLHDVFQIDFDGDLVAFATDEAFYLYPRQCAGIATDVPEIAAKSSWIQITPNPVRDREARFSFSAPAEAPFTLSLHDVGGRLIRQLETSGISGDQRTAFWNSRDSSDRLVMPGVYFVRLQVRGRPAQTEKVTILR